MAVCTEGSANSQLVKTPVSDALSQDIEEFRKKSVLMLVYRY
jgi:hypothetical protein